MVQRRFAITLNCLTLSLTTHDTESSIKLLRMSVSAEPRRSMLRHPNAISVHEACPILEILMLPQHIVVVLLLSNVWRGYLNLSLGGPGFLIGIRLGPLGVIEV